MSKPHPLRVVRRVLTAALLLLGGGVLLLLQAFPNEVATLLASISHFTVDEIRADYGDLTHYWLIGCGLGLCLALAAWRWERESRRDPTLEGAVSARARRWIVVATLTLAPLVGVVFLMRVPLGLRWTFAEDGPAEWLTALVFIVAAVVLWRRSGALRRAGRRRTALVVAGVAALAAFVALEEISYGQRFFGVTTPTWLAAVNDQGEITVHNLDNSLMLAACRVIGFSLFAALLAVTWWWHDLQRLGGAHAAWRDLLPDPALLPLAAIIAFVAQHPRFNELLELYAATFLLVYLAALPGTRPGRLVPPFRRRIPGAARRRVAS